MKTHVFHTCTGARILTYLRRGIITISVRLFNGINRLAAPLLVGVAQFEMSACFYTTKHAVCDLSHSRHSTYYYSYQYISTVSLLMPLISVITGLR